LPSAALNAQDTLTISLPKALEIALSESPTIKVADKEIQRVNYSKKEQVGGLLPTVSVSGAYQRAIKKQKMFSQFRVSLQNPMGLKLDRTIHSRVESQHHCP